MLFFYLPCPFKTWTFLFLYNFCCVNYFLTSKFLFVFVQLSIHANSRLFTTQLWTCRHFNKKNIVKSTKNITLKTVIFLDLAPLNRNLILALRYSPASFSFVAIFFLFALLKPYIFFCFFMHKTIRFFRFPFLFLIETILRHFDLRVRTELVLNKTCYRHVYINIRFALIIKIIWNVTQHSLWCLFS